MEKLSGHMNQVLQQRGGGNQGAGVRGGRPSPESRPEHHQSGSRFSIQSPWAASPNSRFESKGGLNNRFDQRNPFRGSPTDKTFNSRLDSRENSFDGGPRFDKNTPSPFDKRFSNTEQKFSRYDPGRSENNVGSSRNNQNSSKFDPRQTRRDESSRIDSRQRHGSEERTSRDRPER